MHVQTVLPGNPLLAFVSMSAIMVLGSCILPEHYIVRLLCPGASSKNKPTWKEDCCLHLTQQYKLTVRESEVLTHLLHNRSLSDIKDCMCLSKSTVSAHVSRIYKKMGVHNRDQLRDLAESFENSAQL